MTAGTGALTLDTADSLIFQLVLICAKRRDTEWRLLVVKSWLLHLLTCRGQLFPLSRSESFVSYWLICTESLQSVWKMTVQINWFEVKNVIKFAQTEAVKLFHNADESRISPFISTEPCGGNFDASDAGYITTPGYPLEYPPHQNCRWVITAPEPSQRIVLNFNPHFELEKLDCRWVD